ncbi:MAG: pitrilysin family protein [Pseudomonadota bacterium]
MGILTHRPERGTVKSSLPPLPFSRYHCLAFQPELLTESRCSPARVVAVERWNASALFLAGAVLTAASLSCSGQSRPKTGIMPVAQPERPSVNCSTGRYQPLRATLQNGFKVFLYENHTSPVVAFQAWIGVGSTDEEPGEEGIAHVLEHMLFKGTERRQVGQIAQEIENAGGDINAWTSYDQTVYHLVLASRFFDTGLDILSDAVQNPSLDAGELERELRVVSEEIKQGEDIPSRVLTQGLFTTAYATHPYRRPVIGYQRTVEKMTRQKLLAFHRLWYVPGNTTLVVVGDFDSKAALEKIERAWASKGRAGSLRRRPRSEEPQRRMKVTVFSRKVHETQIALAFHVPGVRHVDTAAIDAAAVILGQGESSRLNLLVKREKELATEVYAYSYTPNDSGLLVIGASLPAGDPESTLRAVLRQVFRLTQEEVSPEELAKAQVIIESDAVYQKETVQGMARKLGFFETVAGGIEYEEEYNRLVKDLSPKTIKDTL